MSKQLNSLPTACRLAALALAIALPVASARAQSTTGAMLAQPGSVLPVKEPQSKAAPKESAPDALPGAKTNSDRVTPSNRPVAEMSPNDALFDAINRGDIGDARDAITRGAELDARNVLGLTPIDLSIDLGRNDITMLLLSMRGASSAKPLSAVAKANSGAGKPVKPLPAVAARSASARMAVATKVAGSDPPVKRQLVSTDPGTPAPQVGFLGFGGAPRQ